MEMDVRAIGKSFEQFGIDKTETRRDEFCRCKDVCATGVYQQLLFPDGLSAISACHNHRLLGYPDGHIGITVKGCNLFLNGI